MGAVLRRGVAVVAIGLAPTPAAAWGYQGHEIIAGIARARLAPDVRARVDQILATDADPLTAPDMMARSTWADAYRGAGHRETAQWHFVDLELDHPDLDDACFHHPGLNGVAASQGPAQDCITDKLDAFEAELRSPTTSPQERLLALKYVIHFVGDVHQPLHAADNHDRGGNCVPLALGGPRTVNLHSYWDTAVVQHLGADPQAAATALSARITPEQAAAWSAGDASSGALESFAVAKSVVYRLSSPPGCASDASPVVLPAGYEHAAEAAADTQLMKAGVRLAWVLNRDLGAE